MRAFSELLGAWGSFYVMIGSSAAALTGLMFVVITLVNNNRQTTTRASVSIFSTPTVVHFCCALFTAAFMSAPFTSFVPIALLLGLAGVGGVCYIITVALRSKKLETYAPDAEDWTFHMILPCAAYATLAAGGAELHANARLALFAPPVAVTLLIFIGIHNAWDVVTYITLGDTPAQPDRPADAAKSDTTS